MEYDARKKSLGLAYVFLIFLGVGVRQFYLNNIGGIAFPFVVGRYFNRSYSKPDWYNHDDRWWRLYAG